ncbi:hypothetical protein MICRO8M_140009 [Microbacterium sp. 8M]|nr:hypothetical protein MICRO8M_140009 [Microbacterium sp. 8M]
MPETSFSAMSDPLLSLVGAGSPSRVAATLRPRGRSPGRSILSSVGAYGTHTHPPQTVQDVCALDPSLIFFPRALRRIPRPRGRGAAARHARR